jgi:hypothetical protein
MGNKGVNLAAPRLTAVVPGLATVVPVVANEGQRERGIIHLN